MNSHHSQTCIFYRFESYLDSKYLDIYLAGNKNNNLIHACKSSHLNWSLKKNQDAIIVEAKEWKTFGKKYKLLKCLDEC